MKARVLLVPASGFLFYHMPSTSKQKLRAKHERYLKRYGGYEARELAARSDQWVAHLYCRLRGT